MKISDIYNLTRPKKGRRHFLVPPIKNHFLITTIFRFPKDISYCSKLEKKVKIQIISGINLFCFIKNHSLMRETNFRFSRFFKQWFVLYGFCLFLAIGFSITFLRIILAAYDAEDSDFLREIKNFLKQVGRGLSAIKIVGRWKFDTYFAQRSKFLLK